MAKPLGMQDFDRKKQRKNSSLPDSVHPEYAMYLSTRDMARLGALMFFDGNWNGTQVMPKGWARVLTTLVTPHHEMHPTQLHLRTRQGLWGYGMLWWVWDAPEAMADAMTGPLHGAYSAMGANGQYITVLPAMEMVLAHKVDFDTDGSRQISPEEFHAILSMGSPPAVRAGASSYYCIGSVTAFEMRPFDSTRSGVLSSGPGTAGAMKLI